MRSWRAASGCWRAIFATAREGRIGIDAVYVDATEIIHTEQRLGSLWPELPEVRAGGEEDHPAAAASGTPSSSSPATSAAVRTASVVTLGRGGTDFSAAIARAQRQRARAHAVQGSRRPDDRRSEERPAARVIAGAALPRGGRAGVLRRESALHPRTMIPLVDRKIPLFVRNTFRDDQPARASPRDVKPGAYPVKALTAIHKPGAVAIEGSGMIGVPGVAGRAFTALSQAGHSVSMISQASSEASICFVVPEAEANHAVAALENAFALERKLKLIDRIDAEKKIALIAVVGLGMRGRPGIAARTFSALAAASA